MATEIMQYRIRTQPEEWACTKFCRITLDQKSVVQFIDWLCDCAEDQIEERTRARKNNEPIWFDPVENTWGWDAPRQRMAKLLWQYLSKNSAEKYFRNRFTFGVPPDCADYHVLLPIQDRLKWVMDGLFTRQSEDSHLGQGDWGEQWWLPVEQSEFVRTQLKQTHAELIEHSSDYEDAVGLGLSYYVRTVVQALAVPSRDPARIYVGERRGPHDQVFVWVQDTEGKRFPLPHADKPYREADGTGFEWGYGGHGPGSLALCILADALDGDLVLAYEVDDLEDGFYEKFIADYPRGQDLLIARATVMQWLESIEKSTRFEERRKSVADRLAAHEKTITERIDLLGRIQETGGLRSQRFDIVPDTFESALYLDLMRMLERGGIALRCSGCGLPIPYDHSGRANRQRARLKKGQPIYHPECLIESNRKRKKTHWQRRSQSSDFREAERQRARAYRKIK